MSSVADNLRRVFDTIAEAELKSGRKPGSVSLVAVSKFNPVEAVLEAIAAGQFLFGENRVQEAVPKFQEVQKLMQMMYGACFVNQMEKSLQACERRFLLLNIQTHTRQ